MPAQFDFDGGREPAQSIMALALLHEERGLGKIVLARNGLHRGVGYPRLQRHDGRRIAFERTGRKGVNLPEREFHEMTHECTSRA